MTTRILARGAVAVAVAAALSAGYVAGTRRAEPQIITPAVAALMPAEAAAKTGIPDFSGLVETYGPAVVNISAKHVVQRAAQRRAAPQLPIDPDDPFYQFFRHFYGQIPGMGGGRQPQPDDQPSTSLGSGFIISADGYILTNAHVIDGANVVTVKLTDKREYKAKVVGADKQSDVAVLKIDASGLPIVKIGDPAQSKVGQWVVAIGSPYGFDNTVTSGIISAKSRALPDENYTPFIQTDVPVNPGNSGGPLFNLNGEVIGINSMIYSQTGGFQGLSFAIPINEAMKVKDELVKTGHVSRGRLGVAVQGLNQTLASSFGLQKPDGALVSSVDPKGRREGRAAAGRRDPRGRRRAGSGFVDAARADRGHEAGHEGRSADLARQVEEDGIGDARVARRRSGEGGRRRARRAGAARRRGAPAVAARAQRLVSHARSGRPAIGGARRERGHPARRRDSRGERAARHERRTIARRGQARGQQSCAADPA